MNVNHRDRRRLFLAAIPLGAAVVAACSFPYVTFEPEPQVIEEREPTCPVCTDAGSPEKNADVVVPPDAQTRVDASECSERPPCDCDNDGVGSVNCPVDASTLSAFNGNRLVPGDCDDLADYVYPGQGFLHAPAIPGQPSDWNCDGVEEHDPPQKIVCGGTGASGCTGGRGFLGTPACGSEADLYECRPQANANAACVAVLVGRATQACR